VGGTKRTLALLFCLVFLTQLVSPEERDLLKSRFSLKLTGGAGYSVIGDMNRHLESINNINKPEYWISSGEIKNLNNIGYDFELELMMKLSPRFGIGLATSAPFRRKNESCIVFTQQEIPGLGYQIIEMKYQPDAKFSFPIKLSLYCSWLSTRRFKADIMAGIGFYPGTMSEYVKETYHIYLYSLGNSVSWNTRDWNAKGRFPFGIHGGIGLEYILNDELSLVVDIQGRYARLGNLKASQETRQDSMTFRHSGFLYYCNYYDEVIGAKYGILYVDEIDVKGNENFRKAILDLSGFSLRVGIKVNLY
jgi:hypothetical protein